MKRQETNRKSTRVEDDLRKIHSDWQRLESGSTLQQYRQMNTDNPFPEPNNLDSYQREVRDSAVKILRGLVDKKIRFKSKVTKKKILLMLKVALDVSRILKRFHLDDILIPELGIIRIAMYVIAPQVIYDLNKDRVNLHKGMREPWEHFMSTSLFGINTVDEMNLFCDVRLSKSMHRIAEKGRFIAEHQDDEDLPYMLKDMIDKLVECIDNEMITFSSDDAYDQFAEVCNIIIRASGWTYSKQEIKHSPTMTKVFQYGRKKFPQESRYLQQVKLALGVPTLKLIQSMENRHIQFARKTKDLPRFDFLSAYALVENKMLLP